MRTHGPVEIYRDPDGGTAMIRFDPNGLWYMDVVDAKGRRIRTRDPFISLKGARISLGKLTGGKMKLEGSFDDG